MQEIKCPECGKVFQVDESGYAAIVKQVRDKEFNKEIKDKEAQYKEANENALYKAKVQASKDLTEQLAKKVLYAPSMEKKETIDYLVKETGWTRKEAMDAIGVSTYED